MLTHRRQTVPESLRAWGAGWWSLMFYSSTLNAVSTAHQEPLAAMFFSELCHVFQMLLIIKWEVGKVLWWGRYGTQWPSKLDISTPLSEKRNGTTCGDKPTKGTGHTLKPSHFLMLSAGLQEGWFYHPEGVITERMNTYKGRKMGRDQRWKHWHYQNLSHRLPWRKTHCALPIRRPKNSQMTS